MCAVDVYIANEGYSGQCSLTVTMLHLVPASTLSKYAGHSTAFVISSAYLAQVGATAAQLEHHDPTAKPAAMCTRHLCKPCVQAMSNMLDKGDHAEESLTWMRARTATMVRQKGRKKPCAATDATAAAALRAAAAAAAADSAPPRSRRSASRPRPCAGRQAVPAGAVPHCAPAAGRHNATHAPQ